MEERLGELESDGERERFRATFKSSLKAWTYFAVCFLEDHDRSEGEDSGEKVQKMLDNCKGKRRGKKPAKKRQPTEGKEGFEDVADEDEALNLEKLLTVLMKLAEKRVPSIWKEPLDEESYLKLYVRMVFAMLEKKEVLQSPECRNLLRQTLRNAIQSAKIDRKGLFQLISGKMVHTLYTIVSSSSCGVT